MWLQPVVIEPADLKKISIPVLLMAGEQPPNVQQATGALPELRRYSLAYFILRLVFRRFFYGLWDLWGSPRLTDGGEECAFAMAELRKVNRRGKRRDS